MRWMLHRRTLRACAWAVAARRRAEEAKRDAGWVVRLVAPARFFFLLPLRAVARPVSCDPPRGRTRNRKRGGGLSGGGKEKGKWMENLGRITLA